MKKTNRMISLFLAVFMLTAILASCDWGAHPVPEDGNSSAVAPTILEGMQQSIDYLLFQRTASAKIVTNDNFIYGEYTSMRYGKLNLSFYDVNEQGNFTLGIIYTESPEVNFVGGLHVGSTKEDVLNVFTHEKEPQPLYFSTMEESCGDYIYGDINASWFLENKPKDVIECAYINRFGEDTYNSYMMEYFYYNPLDWTADKSAYTGDSYSMVFYLDSTSDTVTSIRIGYDFIQGMM